MTKISNLYTLTNYISANSSGNVVIAAPSSGYALDVTGTGRFASNFVVGTSSGGVSAPTNILMDSTYKSGSAAFDTLKIFLYKSSIESYGFGLGDLSDMQYWAGASSTGVHRFFTSQTERVRISSSGNVGIGTTSPIAPLHIYSGNTNMASDAASSYTNAKFRLEPYNGSSNGMSMGLISPNINYLQTSYSSGSSAPFVINPYGGNVGVATTSPTRILDARGAVNLSTTAPTASSTSGAYADLHLRTYWGATSSPSRITVVDNWIDYFATYTDGHRFRNWSSDGVVRDLMTITGSGNLGIGTTSPQVKLHVLNSSVGGSYYGQLTVEDSGEAAIQIKGVNYSSIYFSDAAAPYEAGIVYNHSTNLLELRGSGNSADLTITSSGLVKIGVPTSEVNSMLAVVRDGAYPNDVSPAHLSLAGVTDSRMRMSLGYDTTNNYGWINAGQWGVAWTSMYLQKTGGAVYAGSARIDNNSDARVKDNIQPITGALQKVLSMNGKKFHMLDEPEDKIRFGFVAQELQGIVDELVIQSDRIQKLPNGETVENLLGLETWGSSWGALLVEAIKELSAKITALENK